MLTWFKNIESIFTLKKNKKNTNQDILNIIIRYTLLSYLILMIFHANYKIYYVPTGVLIGCFLLYFLIDDEETTIDEQLEDIMEKCRQPTFENPFMNVLQTNKNYKYPACDYNKYKDKIDEYYNFNLYTDVGDIFSLGSTNRQFYTLPNDTVPNDQEAYANWLYKQKYNCKTNGIGCVVYKHRYL